MFYSRETEGISVGGRGIKVSFSSDQQRNLTSDRDPDLVGRIGRWGYPSLSFSPLGCLDLFGQVQSSSWDTDLVGRRSNRAVAGRGGASEHLA